MKELTAEVEKEAAAIIEEEVFVPPTVVQAAIPKGGPVKRKYWKFLVTNFTILQDDYKLPNDSKIRRQIENQGLKHGIKGVKAWQ